jgi:hypothetical protein
MPHQRIPKNTKAQKSQGALRLPTTYANRKNDNEIFAAWHSYVGRWISRDEFGREIISVAFTPRLPRPGKDKPHGTLAGFIAEGEYEGVLFFYRADRNLTRLQATLRLVPPHHTRGKKPGKKRLVLQFKKKRKTKKYVLEWVGPVSDTALSSVCIIGHRGLGFAGLDNRPKALSRAWYFGASGIEFDITVPYSLESRS